VSIPRPPTRLIQFSPRVKRSSLLRAASSSSPAILDLTEKLQVLALANPEAYKIISSLVDEYLVDLITTRAGALPDTIARRLRVLMVRPQRKQRSTGGG